MGFGFDFASEWSYDSSEDHSVSVLVASGGYGTLRLVHDNGQKMLIPYTYFGLGESKGADLGYSESTFEMDSSGSRVTCNGIFDDSYFPCKGYILTAGLVSSQTKGFALTEYLFGAFPVRAGVKCRGAVNSAIPGAGISCSMAFFQEATFV